jgi:hypothetical protein
MSGALLKLERKVALGTGKILKVWGDKFVKPEQLPSVAAL